MIPREYNNEYNDIFHGDYIHMFEGKCHKHEVYLYTCQKGWTIMIISTFITTCNIDLHISLVHSHLFHYYHYNKASA